MARNFKGIIIDISIYDHFRKVLLLSIVSCICIEFS